MSDIVIRVENLSKQYRLGSVGTGALSHDINRLWHKVRGKEDPYLMVGETNDRTVKGSSDYVWALRDVNFDVKQGEVLGIIGRNGAGKSTLLKILSRTTTPTTGSIKIKGRVASLLEVGTGFHPELSGRENIFLNGAILGMTRQEIKNKFDEIVDFAGVERYIDTPVKRYSSGMYVRLAFGVAAHLEPEILIVDEVLAVGDVEFQKKALGKMKQVSEGQGRTVLFVSHNISAIKALCNTCLLMKNGNIEAHGTTQKVINKYFEPVSSGNQDYVHRDGTQQLTIKNIDINNSKAARVNVLDEIVINISYDIRTLPDKNIEFFILLSNESGEYVNSYFERDLNEYTMPSAIKGRKQLKTTCNLFPGKYYLSAGIFDHNREFIDWVEFCESFVVEEYYSDKRNFNDRLGLIVGNGKWSNE
ncbi:MAG: ABC transporter ATP-binding protein [Ferruginibacter sp.]